MERRPEPLRPGFFARSTENLFQLKSYLCFRSASGFGFKLIGPAPARFQSSRPNEESRPRHLLNERDRKREPRGLRERDRAIVIRQNFSVSKDTKGVE